MIVYENDSFHNCRKQKSYKFFLYTMDKIYVLHSWWLFLIYRDYSAPSCTFSSFRCSPFGKYASGEILETSTKPLPPAPLPPLSRQPSTPSIDFPLKSAEKKRISNIHFVPPPVSWTLLIII